MYSDIKSRMKFTQGLSQAFSSNKGVKQGDVLSPLLFNIFINGIVNKLEQNEPYPVLIGDIPINCLLYADDIIRLSSSPDGLQKSLDSLADFCSCWKLKVNTSKSKIVVFNSNGKSFINHFKCDGNIIDTVSNYCYLGITLKCNAFRPQGYCPTRCGSCFKELPGCLFTRTFLPKSSYTLLHMLECLKLHASPL